MAAPNPGDVPIYVGPEWEPGPSAPKSMGSVIYKPGVASAGDSVATWPEVQVVIAASHGKCVVYVDDSVVSPAPIPGATGVTECFGRVELRPFKIDSVNFSVLEIQDGATLDNLYQVTDLELRMNCQSATPSLTWTGTPTGGFLMLWQFGYLSQATTATQPGIVVPAGTQMLITVDNGSIIAGQDFTNPVVPPIAVPATATFAITSYNNSDVFPNFASGSGTIELTYDDSSASFFTPPGVAPLIPAFTGTYDAFQDWVSPIEQTFTATTANIFQSGPKTGVRPVTFRGCGGGGGGGGGSGGTASDPGSGGAAGGAAAYQEVTVDVDFSHQINVVVDVGGLGGVGGSGGGGAGANGGDGGPTYVIDAVTNVVLCAFLGASGGTGGVSTSGGILVITQGGSNISGQQYAGGTGFVGAGGIGGGPGTAGSPGVANAVSIGAPLGPPALSPVWLPGTGGTSGDATQGGGGGGGGQGPFGNGGNGGNCVGGVTTNGSAPALGSGGGGGGGAGAALSPLTPGPGSSGGSGGSGRITSSYQP
jgi:hypothetical protein